MSRNDGLRGIELADVKYEIWNLRFRIPMHHFYLAVAILSEVIATCTLKSSEKFTRLGPSIVVVLGYCSAFYFLTLALDRIQLGVAYAIWSGVGILLVALVGWFYYRQTLDTPAIFGMGLIIAGVVVLNLFSKTAVH